MFTLPRYPHSPTAENLISLERSDYFHEVPFRVLLSLLSVACITLNLSSIIRFKPPNHFKTNVAMTAWVFSLGVQYQILQLGKILIGAPQRLYTIADYGAPAEHHKMKTQLMESINSTVRLIFTLQLISTSFLAVSRDALYTVILLPLVYAREDWRFSLLLIYDFYLKLRKTPRLEKVLCCLCILMTFLNIDRWTWLSKIVPLLVYAGLSFRVLTSNL